MFVCLFLSFISIFPLFFNQLLEVYSQQYRNRVSLFNSSSGLSPFTSSSVASLVCFCFFPLLHFTPLGLVSCAVLLFVFLFGMAFKTHDLLSFIPESLFELVRVCLPLVFTGWFCGSVVLSPARLTVSLPVHAVHRFYSLWRHQVLNTERCVAL